MMRKLFVVAMVAGLLGMGGLVRDARAGATVDMLFIGTTGAGTVGSNTIQAAAGDTLTMAVLMKNDVPVSLAQFMIVYDLPGPTNELDIVSVVVWGGVPVAGAKGAKFTPISPPSLITQNVISSFNSAVPPPPALPLAPFGGAFAAAFPTGYQMGTVTWVATGASGTTIGAGINLQGVIGQAFIGTGGVNISSTVLFNAASVVIPEPATAALLGLGLVGIMAVGRRRRRS